MKGRTKKSDSNESSTPSALFIPLKRRYFEEFERGEKHFEYRTYGPRWNEKTCAIGRRVTLSLGYGKQRRMTGEVTSFSTCATPSQIPGWADCFGDSHFTAAVIGIRVDREPCPHRILAKKIATQLFINGLGDRGTRLEIKQGTREAPERSLGGWCYQAAVDQIKKAIIAR